MVAIPRGGITSAIERVHLLPSQLHRVLERKPVDHSEWVIQILKKEANYAAKRGVVLNQKLRDSEAQPIVKAEKRNS